MAGARTVTIVGVAEPGNLRTTAFEDVVAAAIGGGPAEVDRLFHWIRPAIVRYCRARINASSGNGGGNGDADDVAQEVCAGVLAALPNFNDALPRFLPFLYGIASHKVVDHYRKCRRDRSDSGREVPDRVDSSPGPEAFAVLRDSSARVSALMVALTERQRDVLAMRVVAGLTSAEAAQAIGMTPSAVRVTQRRALIRLRAAIAADEQSRRLHVVR